MLVLNSARKFIGEAAHCLALVRELEKRGHEAVLGVRAGYDVEKRANMSGQKTISFHFPGSFTPRLDLGDVRTLRRYIAENDPDVIHCHRGKDHWIAVAATLLKRYRRPIVRTRHVVVPVKNHALNRWLLCKKTHAILAVSDKAADSLSAFACRSQVKTIYSAVDTDRFRPDRRSDEWRKEVGCGPGSLLVGLIGRFQNIKGQHIFLEAASRVARTFPNARFLLSGAGPPHKIEHLQRQAERLGMSERVVLRNWIENIEVAVASLDIGVVASLGSEGSSRITFEYMASGVPVVATMVGGIPEILRGEKAGVLVEPGNPEALADALSQLLESEEQRRSLTASALALIHEKYTYDRWLDEILKVYQSVIEAQKPR